MSPGRCWKIGSARTLRSSSWWTSSKSFSPSMGKTLNRDSLSFWGEQREKPAFVFWSAFGTIS